MLHGVTAQAPNHIWGSDITSIRLRNSWLYLVAILDWFSRYLEHLLHNRYPKHTRAGTRAKVNSGKGPGSHHHPSPNASRQTYPSPQSSHSRHVVSKRTSRDIDCAIFQALWRWASRRHPSKGAGGVKTRYFRTSGGRNWVFFGDVEGQRKHLRLASRIPIRRHTKLRGEANPYDPAWDIDFEQRLNTTMAVTLHGQRQLLTQWKVQNGLCPICNQPTTEETRWHTHHIIWRGHGGPDTAGNRVLYQSAF